ncbi:MAG: PD-(D/E)XK nuclease family protein [Acidobacteria bacterium]|nr:PD-(D/E)XK nuclease family protein [Acidobacteriota bacterium]
MKCLAKAIWYGSADKKILPTHPAAILGTCFHAVVAAAHTGGLIGDNASVARTAARTFFDQQARLIYENAHPLLKAKYSDVGRLPYYNLHRERAALHASQIAAKLSSADLSGETHEVPGTQGSTELRLESADGLIVGRPDHIDVESETVVDYKSGIAAKDERATVSDPETRQLRLYAYLASERGLRITKGAIVRGDGSVGEIEIPQAEAAAEAARARTQLEAVNSAVSAGQSFVESSSPSTEGCRMCSCIPLCETFWRDSKPEWADQCGLQVEGRVTDIVRTTAQGTTLVTFAVEVRRGTLDCSSAVIEQVPETWLLVQGAAIPQVGDTVRIVHARRAGPEGDIAVLRVDKILTSVWSVPTTVGS